MSFENAAEAIGRIVDQRQYASPMPYLHDETVRRRALEIARQQGLLERIEKELDPRAEIPVVRHSLFRDFRRTGNRTRCEQVLRRRVRQIELAGMACWLGMDYTEYLKDLLWAECESSWWILPAHEPRSRPIDLRAAMVACDYARVAVLLKDVLDAEVRERIEREIRTRIGDNFLDPDREFWWKTRTNNWNAVCLGGVGLAAMLVEKEPARLKAILVDVVQHVEYFLGSFTEDGGCDEGAGYWRYGFGWYARLAAGLYDFTGGQVNLMEGERIERICRFPLAVTVAPGQDLTFADAHGGYLSAATAVLINRFHDLPELFGLCRLTADGMLAVESLTDLLLRDGVAHEPAELSADAFLPDLAVVKLRSGDLTLGAKAGHNNENHNHNDVGSFILHRGRTFFLCDPGAPVYSARTFSDKRYESVFCNSFGHSVPAIDGRGQQVGEEFSGTIRIEPPTENGAKSVHIEMAGAYGLENLQRLTRTIELPAGGGEMMLTDVLRFRQAPSSLEEVFMTYQSAERDEDGQGVTIRSASDGEARLRAVDTAGRFEVVELAEESEAESRAGELLRRIVFVPETLTPDMTLRFVVRMS